MMAIAALEYTFKNNNGNSEDKNEKVTEKRKDGSTTFGVRPLTAATIGCPRNLPSPALAGLWLVGSW